LRTGVELDRKLRLRTHDSGLKQTISEEKFHSIYPFFPKPFHLNPIS
jgi:hypothetical protein